MKKALIILFAWQISNHAYAMGEIAENDSIAIQQQIPEIVVSGTRDEIDERQLPMVISVVGKDKLVENQRQNILPTIMEQVPSLMLTSRGLMGFGVSTGAAGGIMLRGISSGSGQILVMIDGHPQYNGIYGHSIADSYQTIMAERVEVVRGPASLLYGSNAMGGAINIVTRKLDADAVKTTINIGAGSYGTVQADASNMIKNGNFSSTIALQYGRSDNHRPNMDFEQYGGFAKLNYDISDNWNTFADIDLTHFNASNPGSVQNEMIDNDQWITRGSIALGIENRYEHTNGAISIYDNFGRHKINDGYAANGGEPQTRLFRSKDALIGVNWYQNAELFQGNKLTIGFDWQHIYGRAYYTSRENGEVLETKNKQSAHVHNNEVAGYISFMQTISILTFDAGVRYDYHSVAGGEWVPQAGIVVRPMSNGEIRAMVSKGFRNPTMREMYLYPPSNEDLKAERLINYELSFKHRPLGGLLSYGVNMFYIKADNIIQTIQKQNVNTGEIENKGIEVEMKWNVTDNLSLNTNHSWLNMKNHIVAAPEYKGYLGLNYVGKKVSIASGFMQVCNLFTAVGENEEKENFSLLNITFGYHINNTLKVWTKGENLLGQHYEINAGYPMPKATFMGGLAIEL